MLGSVDGREWTLPPAGSPGFAELWLQLVALLAGGRAPRGMVIHGPLLLHQTRIRSLPPELDVRGSLDLRQCERLRSLGSNLRVAGDLTIGGGSNPPRWLQRIWASQPTWRSSRERSCPLPELPEGLDVQGHLVLRRCSELRGWPSGLRVGGDIEVHRCPELEGVALPADAVVGGELRRTGRRPRLRPSKGRPRGEGRAREHLTTLDPAAWESALEVLEQVVADATLALEPSRLAVLLARARRSLRRRRSEAAPVAGPSAPAVRIPARNPGARCYVCGERGEVSAEPAYPRHCRSCAELEREKRAQRCDLGGRVALVTGGRVKIGFETALRLLRDGGRVLVTTRFAQDALRRYAALADFESWRERLRIYRLDFRFIPDVLTFTEHLCREEAALDILVNNAAQTVARPLEFYAEELALEREGAAMDRLVGGHPLVGDVPTPVAPSLARWRDGLQNRLELGPDRSARLLMEGAALAEREVTLEQKNSWTLRLDEVPPAELLEVLLVNSAAPYYLCAGLEPLLRRSTFADRYIVNVNGADGTFGRPRKTVTHPHVNMSKAALNMLTRTAARDYAARGIYMSSVDVGWVSLEGPSAQQQRLAEAGFSPPLEAADAAARVCDPIVRGIRDGDRRWGLLFRHYEASAW